MRPQPASSMSGTTAWQQSNVPVRFTARMRFHVSIVIDRNGIEPVESGAVHEDRRCARAAFASRRRRRRSALDR